MTERHSDNSSTALTPQQSADVIIYYNNGDNQEARNKGWKDKIPMGRSALRATSGRHSILPSGKPLLTFSEANEGIDYILQQEINEKRLQQHLSTPARTDYDRDPMERAANDHLDD